MTTSEYDNTPFEEHHKPTGIRLVRPEPVGPGGPVPWDAALVEIFATLFFIMHDADGFRLGKPAYPDKIELNAPELPAALRGTVFATRYGQARS